MRAHVSVCDMPMSCTVEMENLEQTSPLLQPLTASSRCVIASFAIALSSHRLITTKQASESYFKHAGRLYQRSKISSLILSFLFFFQHPSLLSLLLISPISASSRRALSPSLHIPWWVGGKFNGDVGSQKGRGGVGVVEGLPHTRAQYVCKPGASYQPIQSVRRRGWLPGSLNSLGWSKNSVPNRGANRGFPKYSRIRFAYSRNLFLVSLDTAEIVDSLNCCGFFSLLIPTSTWGQILETLNERRTSAGYAVVLRPTLLSLIRHAAHCNLSLTLNQG